MERNPVVHWLPAQNWRPFCSLFFSFLADTPFPSIVFRNIPPFQWVIWKGTMEWDAINNRLSFSPSTHLHWKPGCRPHHLENWCAHFTWRDSRPTLSCSLAVSPLIALQWDWRGSQRGCLITTLLSLVKNCWEISMVLFPRLMFCVSTMANYLPIEFWKMLQMPEISSSDIFPSC